MFTTNEIILFTAWFLFVLGASIWLVFDAITLMCEACVEIKRKIRKIRRRMYYRHKKGI